ncbi:MAG: hypothetical protein AB203_00825 [Parcubacteria bacterium C7867-008]|nr:MAG: hypothetical protein AB203_00825 [Parcubacteria bacterium C7867-008]
MIARILLGICSVISVLLFVIIGYGTSSECLVGDNPLAQILLLPPLLILWFGLYSSFKTPTLRRAVFILLFALFIAFVTLYGSGTSRCSPNDSSKKGTLRTLQKVLSEYYADNHSYPETLSDFSDYIGPRTEASDIRYSHTKDSYQMCTTIKYKYFYHIPLNAGEEYCLGS